MAPHEVREAPDLTTIQAVLTTPVSLQYFQTTFTSLENVKPAVVMTQRPSLRCYVVNGQRSRLL